MSILVALISPNDDSQEVVDDIIVVADVPTAESLEPGYDYYIDTTTNPADLGDIYDPTTNTFSTPPVDYAGDLAAAYELFVSDLTGLINQVNVMSNSDVNSGTDYDTGYAEVDTSSLPDDFMTNVWPAIQAYMANIAGG